ncbi:MAG: hypothetical protein WC679_00190 [Bacteroidales bacterium]|jgi:hypothetical protein
MKTFQEFNESIESLNEALDDEFKQAMDKFLGLVIKSYEEFGFRNGDQKNEFVEKFKKELTYKDSKLYVKVSSNGSAYAFVVKEDGAKFKKGDILKPASWNAPAKNFARGNIFADGYKVNWAGF